MNAITFECNKCLTLNTMNSGKSREKTKRMSIFLPTSFTYYSDYCKPTNFRVLLIFAIFAFV